jgi:hypothetical protein
MKVAGTNFPDEAGVFHLQKIVKQGRRVEKQSFLANAFPLLPSLTGEFWHVTCSNPSMARKSHALKMALETHGSAGLNRRLPMPSTSALYLAQLHSHALKVPPRARLHIAVQMDETSTASCVVKIIHADSI